MAKSGSVRDEPVRTDRGSLLIRVWAHPGSDRDSVDGIDPFRRAFVVRVKAPPVEGEATAAVVALVSNRLGCETYLETGATSRLKVVRAATDMSPDEASARLLGVAFNKFKRKD